MHFSLQYMLLTKLLADYPARYS